MNPEPATHPPNLSFELLDPSALRAMMDGDLAAASNVQGRELPSFFLEEKWLWEIRLHQIETSPDDAPWLVRAVVLHPGDAVVGHAGFHGPPDEAGMIELAYTIAPEHRGNGYAHAVLKALLDEATASPDVTTARATVSPDNAASLAVIHRGQFTQVGEQWDEVDGLELVFEKSVGAANV